MADDRPRAFVPDDFDVPRELVTGEFRLEPLGPQHNAGDYEAWMSSIDHIRATPGFEGWRWPDPEMTSEQNLGDLQRHADDFARRRGFTYTVLEGGSDRVIGCVYIYPSPADPGITEVRSWVTARRADLDSVLHETVDSWLAADWPFTNVRYRDNG